MNLLRKPVDADLVKCALQTLHVILNPIYSAYLTIDPHLYYLDIDLDNRSQLLVH